MSRRFDALMARTFAASIDVTFTLQDDASPELNKLTARIEQIVGDWGQKVIGEQSLEEAVGKLGGVESVKLRSALGFHGGGRPINPLGLVAGRGKAYVDGEEIGDVDDLHYTAELDDVMANTGGWRDLGRTRSGTFAAIDVSGDFAKIARAAAPTPQQGPDLDEYAQALVGLTRAPGESDAAFRDRIRFAIRPTDYGKVYRDTVAAIRTDDAIQLRRRAMPPQTPNPYNRRGPEARERRADAGVAAVEEGIRTPHFDMLADGRAAFPGFRLTDLESLLGDHFAKGFNAGEGTFERHVEEELLPRVKRTVWGEGHAAGRNDGMADLIGRVEDLYGQEANEVLAALSDAETTASRIEEAKTDESIEVTRAMREQTSRKGLLELNARAAALLRKMIEGQHNGFSREMPF